MGKVSWKTRMMNKLLSEQVYYNLQTMPLMFMLMPILWLLLIDITYVFWIFFGYGIWIVTLKYLKMSYEERFKIYRYLYSIVYDIDHHKPVTGWIDIDVSETYPIELGEKDKRTIEIAHINKKIETLKKKKDTLLNQFSVLKLSKKSLKKKKKSKKTKEDPFYDEDRQDIQENKQDDQLEGYKNKLDEIRKKIEIVDGEINELEKNRNETEKELEKIKEKKKEALKQENKYKETKEKYQKKLKQKNKQIFNQKVKKGKLKKEKEIINHKLDSLTKVQTKPKSKKQLKNKIEEIDFEIYELDESLELLIEQKRQLEEARIKEIEHYEMQLELQEEYPEARFKYFRSQIAWSDIYDSSEEEEIVFILPSQFDETFIFTNDIGNFSNLVMNVPAYSVATFIEVARFKNVPYLLCYCSSYHVKESGLTKIKKEIAEKYVLDAKLSFLADEISQIHYEYETLKTDNLDLENQNTALLNELMKIDKRKKERLETIYRMNRLSFDMPPKRLYAVTILGYILTLVFLLLFIFYPYLFNPNQTYF